MLYDIDLLPLGSFGTSGGEEGCVLCPMGCTVGPDDNVYVCDEGNNRIQVFDQRYLLN